MTTILRAPVPIIVAAMLISSAAASQEHSVRIWGFGIQSCGTWITARRTALGAGASFAETTPAIANLAWVEGFITAFATTSPDVDQAARHTDVDGMQSWIDNYCSAHPLRSIAKAAEALVNELSHR